MLPTYRRRFQKLRVASSRQHGEAPYKPALLLAVLEGIADSSIPDNRIAITPELIVAFKAICTYLGTSPLFTAANFVLPFYHLRPADELDLIVRDGKSGDRGGRIWRRRQAPSRLCKEKVVFFHR